MIWQKLARALAKVNTWAAFLVLVSFGLSVPAIAADPSQPVDLPPFPGVSGELAESGLFSLRLDYLGWSVSGDKLPALISTGVLGAPGTRILFGNSTVNDNWRSGGQLTAEYFFDSQHLGGAELGFFDLANITSSFRADSNAYPTLERPFLNASSGAPDFLVALPGSVSGTATASDTSRFLGAHALYRQAIGNLGKERFSALIGYRFLYELDELSIASASNLDTGFLVGNVDFRDFFKATTSFHGIDLGVMGSTTEGRLRIEWRAMMALGANLDEARIDGTTTITSGRDVTSTAGGLLALSSNIGTHSQARFGAAPELSLVASYEVMPSWRLVLGYHLIYWMGVQRAGDLIDTTINTALIPPPSTGGGSQRPAARFDTTALLAQGFSFGIKHEF